MTELVTMPNILWRVEKFASTYKKLSPTISFSGQKWKLKFTQFIEGSSEKLQLILERLSTSENLPNLQFNTDTCILYSNDSRYLTKNTKSSFRHKEWCIWSEYFVNIYKSLGHIVDISFLIMITPTGLNHLLSFDEEESQKATEASPCVVSLCEDIGKLFNSDEQSDFVLKCRDRSFPAHKAILSTRSDYFAAMFRSDMKETLEGVAEINNVEPDILEQVLCYLYTGKIPDLCTDSIREIYAVADRFAVEPLKVKCGSLFISYTMDPKKDSEATENEQSDGKPIESNDAKDKQLLKDLFLSREWEILSHECPQLAHEMCKPIFLRKP